MIGSLEQLEQSARGVILWERFGRPIAYKLTKDGRKRYEVAKIKGFANAAIRASEGGAALQNVWWEYCRIAQVPFVIIEGAARRQRVTVDLLHSGSLSVAGQVEAWRLVQGARRSPKNKLRQCSSYVASCGPVRVSVAVYPDDAEIVAAQLRDIVHGHLEPLGSAVKRS